MPFSFKPEASQTTEASPATAAAPQASFGNSAIGAGGAGINVMSRAVDGGKSMFQLALMALAGLSVLASVGLAGYLYYLSSQVDAKKAQLASYETQLGALPLEDMRKLSGRIKLIDQLVKQHPSANVAFRIIEDSVENQVTYTKFDLGYSDSLKSYNLSVTGLAPSYKSVAQQIDTFGRKPYSTYISNVAVDGLAPDTSGQISFSARMPISIIGLLPEDLNLSDGAAALAASSTQASSQEATTTAAATGSPVMPAATQ
jgi:hypothetical protein